MSAEEDRKRIEVDWWLGELPSEAVLRSLVGEIVDVLDVPDLPTGLSRTPFGEFFRFARVLSVESIAGARECPRCGHEDAGYEIRVQWESGRHAAGDSVVCEQCVVGRVVFGGELIRFADIDWCHPRDRQKDLPETC